MMRSRVAAAAVLALAGLALPGCPAFNNALKVAGVVRPPKLEITPAVPQDFELKIHVTDQQAPPADYLITYRRSGKCDYRVTTRAPKRSVQEGQFELLENQVMKLWALLGEIDFPSLDDRYPGDGLGPDAMVGIQAYSVRGNDLSKEVQTHFQSVPELETLRTVALSFLPEKAVQGTGTGQTAVGKSTQIVGDVQTRVFYPADDERLKDVPAERRQPFGTWQDAVNFGFSPVQGFRPWERRE